MDFIAPKKLISHLGEIEVSLSEIKGAVHYDYTINANLALWTRDENILNTLISKLP